MRIYEIIQKKKLGKELSPEEITFTINGFTSGRIPDVQMAALLMAIYFKGMTPSETTALTMAMVESGDQMDLSLLPGIKVDKHSTGGVGDKTTLVVGPIVAALGVPVAKMSGRGLGHTGGTVDKLESIPGLRTEIPTNEFLGVVTQHGICITGQSANFAPADKKIYALRDVTATVDSIPLIAASIMSKKIAAGADRILLDIKTGNGAFMKSLADSQTLAKAMVEIGEGCGRKTKALITDMSVPLGNAVGNYLEILEVIDVLKDCGPEDMAHICIELSAQMLSLAEKGSLENCRKMAKQALSDGSALAKFTEMIAAQGGDISYLLNEESQGEKFPLAKFLVTIPSPTSSYIASMDTEGIGNCAVALGAGREKLGDTIDFTAGIVINKKTGDMVNKSEPLAVLHAADLSLAKSVMQKYLDCITFSDTPIDKPTLVYG